MRRMYSLLTASCVMSVLLTACATVEAPPAPVPVPQPAPTPVVTPVPTPAPAVAAPITPLRPAVAPPTVSAAPPAPIDIVPLQFSSAAFESLPNWAETDVGAARRALVRSCAISQARPKDQLLSAVATYSGRVGDWARVCALANDPSLEDRTFWESQFQAWRVATETTEVGRLTGYYEPIMAASRVKTPVYSEPIQSRPADLFEIDLGQFDPTLRNRSIVARMDRGKVVPYWSRAQISQSTAPVLAWGEPAEVLSLQVQGSGRLQFDDGSQVRAAFAAHNGHRFGSNAQELIRRGALPVTVPRWMRSKPGSRPPHPKKRGKF